MWRRRDRETLGRHFKRGPDPFAVDLSLEPGILDQIPLALPRRDRDPGQILQDGDGPAGIAFGFSISQIGRHPRSHYGFDQQQK
jgi:hypothetical protein